jgi:hypothetical protein
MDRSKVIFNNEISKKDVRKAAKSKAKYIKKFGDDSNVNYPVRLVKNQYIGDSLGVSDIRIESGEGEAFDQERVLLSETSAWDLDITVFQWLSQVLPTLLDINHIGWI